MDDRVLRTLRMQAWERAKAELMSFHATFWSRSVGDRLEFANLNILIRDFIDKIEEEGYIE